MSTQGPRGNRVREDEDDEDCAASEDGEERLGAGHQSSGECEEAGSEEILEEINRREATAYGDVEEDASGEEEEDEDDEDEEGNAASEDGEE